uniref:Uncharacterized protein n=1 Tax=Arundo donax TaxID=35708 RepID=A0A0A9CSK0_ARUDO
MGFSLPLFFRRLPRLSTGAAEEENLGSVIMLLNLESSATFASFRRIDRNRGSIRAAANRSSCIARFILSSRPSTASASAALPSCFPSLGFLPCCRFSSSSRPSLCFRFLRSASGRGASSVAA